MKMKHLVSGFAIILLARTQGMAQITDVTVGVNLWDALSSTVSIQSRVVIRDHFAFQVEGGLCPGRTYTSLSNIQEKAKGGFLSAGPKAIFGNAETGAFVVSLNGLFSVANRDLEIDIPDYYQDYSDQAHYRTFKWGWNVQAGVLFKQGRLQFEPSGELSFLQSRSDVHGFDYWSPGVGRLGLSSNANTKPMNWTIGLNLVVMYDFIR